MVVGAHILKCHYYRRATAPAHRNRHLVVLAICFCCTAPPTANAATGMGCCFDRKVTCRYPNQADAGNEKRKPHNTFKNLLFHTGSLSAPFKLKKKKYVTCECVYIFNGILVRSCVQSHFARKKSKSKGKVQISAINLCKKRDDRKLFEILVFASPDHPVETASLFQRN